MSSNVAILMIAIASKPKLVLVPVVSERRGNTIGNLGLLAQYAQQLVQHGVLPFHYIPLSV